MARFKGETQIIDGNPGHYYTENDVPFTFSNQKRATTQMILDEPINYKKVVSETFQKILCNKGYNIDSDNTIAKNILEQFCFDNNFKILFTQIVQLCSEFGFCMPILEWNKLRDKIFLTFANPMFIQKNAKAFIGKTGAVIYRNPPNIDDASTYQRIEFNDKYAVVDVIGLGDPNELFLEQVSQKIPDEYMSSIDYSKSMKQLHYMNCVPVGCIYNKCYFLYQNFNAITQTMVEPQTDWWNGKGAFELSNRILSQTLKELIINRSRLAGNLSPTTIQKMMQDKDLGELFTDLVITQTPEQGSTKTVNFQYLSGEPKLEQYLNAYKQTFQIAMRAAGISEGAVENGVQKTTGEIAMVLNNTTETLKLRRLMLAEQIMSEIFDKVLMAHNVEPWQDNKRVYNFDIVGTDMLDESSLTSVLIEQIEAGLATREYAVGRLRNINSQDAIQSIMEIDKKRERDLDILMQYDNEGDGDNDKQSEKGRTTTTKQTN